MKLKFIYLLLAAFLLIGSAQALTSCKDTDEDIYAQLREENLSIQQQHNKDFALLKEQLANLRKVDSLFAIYKDSLNAELKDFARKDTLPYYVMKDSLDNLISKLVEVESFSTTFSDMVDSLRASYDTLSNHRTELDSLAARYTRLESDLGNLSWMLENSILGDAEGFNDFVQNTFEKDSIMNIDISELKTAVQNLNTFKDTWEPKLGTIEKNASDALAKATKNESDIKALTNTVNTLDSLIQANKCNCDTAMINALNRKVTEIEGNLQTVLDDYVKKADLDQAIAGLATKDALDSIASILRQEAQANLDSLEVRLQAQIDDCITRLDGVDTTLGEINTAISTLESDMRQAKLDIQANKENIEILSKSLDSVIVRVFNLENRISSIVLQGAANPVFGYLKTPFGFESNVLMNYMGEANNYVEFPNLEIEGAEYDGKLKEVLTPADIAFLKACGITGAVTYASGATLFSEADGNLGTLYLTLNPANIDLTGKEFTVVTSQNKVMPIELKNLRPSKAELTHGYSRTATSANGFYEADVTVAPGDVPALRVVVDKQLKAAAKKVLSERNASSILALGNALYEQFNGILPALGIRAAWQESDGAENPTMKEQSVYSKYGLAAATFNPLSYKFLYGKSFRQFHLPDISGMLDDYKFDFTDQGLNITFDPITIDGVNVDFSLSLNTNIGDIDLGTISTTTTVKIDDFPIGFNEDTQELETTTKYIEVPVTINLNDTDLAANLTSAIEDAINGALDGLDGQIKSQFQSTIDKLLGQIEGQVNGMLTSLQTQVNDKLGGILENLQDQVNGKIEMIGNQITNNALYNRLQALINKFNGVLADPNHYLQPVLLYSLQGQSYGMFSQNKALPSQFVGNGNAVMLTPTTYTGETVSPAFKKFVAVTNVYKSADYSVNVSNNDTCKQLAKQANAQPYMNEVVSGERRTIPFYFEGGKGYTYEIVYQALDYSGVTSTAKYYVSIK